MRTSALTTRTPRTAADSAIFPLLGWGKLPALGWLLSAMRFRNPFELALQLSTALTPAVTAFIWLLLASFVVCVGLTVRGFATGKFDSVLPLRIVRATANYVVVLQITIVERMARVFTCGTITPGVWSTTTISCSGSAYALMSAVTVVVVALFLAFSTVVAAVSFNRDYRAEATVYSRRAIGRVEAVMMVLRTALTLLFTNSASVSVSLLLVSSTASGLLFATLYLRFLPELAAWRNKLMCCLGAAFFFTSLCSIAATLLPEETSDSWRPLLAVVFYVGLPGSVALAYIAVSARLTAAAADPATPRALALAYPTDVEVVARAQVAAALADAAPPRVAPAASGAAAAGAEQLDIALMRAVGVLQRGSEKLFPGSALMDCLHANFLRGYPRAAEVVDYAPFLRELRATRAKALRGGLRRLRGAVGGSGGSEGAKLLSEEESAAAFFAAPAPPPAPFPPAIEVELALLNAGLTKSSSVDVRFLLSQARAAAATEEFEALERAAATLRGQHRWERVRLTAVQEVQKQQLVGEASVSTLRAMAAQLRLWATAVTADGGGGGSAAALGPLYARLAELSHANRGALGALAYLHALAPGSSAALMAQGSYLLGVVGDARGAAAAFSRGERALAEEEKAVAGGDKPGAGAGAAETAEAGVVLLSAAQQRAFARTERFHGGGSGDGDRIVGNALPNLADMLSGALRALPAGGGAAAAARTPPLLATRVGSPFPTGGAKAAREPFYGPLRLRARCVLALAVALYSVAVGVTQYYAAQTLQSAREVLASGDRHVLMARMARLAFRGAAAAAGALRPAPGGGDAFTFNTTLAGLAFDAEALKSAHRPLFASARASPLPAEVALFTAMDAVPLVALAGGGGTVAYTSSFGDAVMTFAASAAPLAPLGALPAPVGANFSLSGAPEGAFFLVANMDGALGTAAARATALAGARLAAQRAAAMSAEAWTVFAVMVAPALAGAALLLAPLLGAWQAVGRALAALRAAPPVVVEGPREHSRRCFKALLNAALDDDRHLARLLTEQAGIPPAGAEEVVASANGGDGGCGGGSGGKEVGRAAVGVGAGAAGGARAWAAGALAAAAPRATLLARFFAPLALLLLYAGGCLAYSRAQLVAAERAGEAVAVLAALRSTVLPPTAAAQAALTNGLSRGLWRSPPPANVNLEPPPACNVSALLTAAAVAAAAARGVDAALDAASAVGAAFPDPALQALLLGGACDAVAGRADVGGDAMRGGWNLGLLPLDCSGGVAPGAPTTGAFFGRAGNGLIGAARAHASALVELLQRRAMAVAAGSGAAPESASFMLGGSAAAVVAPEAPAGGGAWPCAPPLLEQPGRAWQADAALHQLVEPAARAALATALEWHAGALAALQVMQSVSAAVMPLIAAALYYLLLLPAINELDSLQKLAKWVTAKTSAQEGE